MAFIKKTKSRFQVRQGNSGVLLSSFKNKADAEKEVKALHAKNKPKQSNKGKSASKKFK